MEEEGGRECVHMYVCMCVWELEREISAGPQGLIRIRDFRLRSEFCD